ncbi:MAG: GNAT family N-acetyltransferase [Pseudopedobacter saltans]|uniref:GNAT family N-acetyltransferase n=1 Tax=Pseudopedobacter saltans TaxID=151895 RepID=A0A2W5EU51_9SPHI|nr:MAG: GNAT family N-acetyltransferase [Pseudopedobacter saltans]
MNHTIVPITQQDIPLLVDLINLSYRNKSDGAWTTEADLFNEGGLRIDANELISTMSTTDNYIFKYVLDGDILGTVTLTEKPTAIYLGTLAVSPRAQGLGIGKKILLFANEFAKQKSKDKVTLTAISVRKDLIDWYERFGYVKTGNITPFPTSSHELSTPVQDLFFEEMVFHI